MTFFKWLKRIIIGFIVLLVLVISGALGWRGYERADIGEAQQVNADTGIQSLEAVMIGGVRQWVKIQGEDTRNPVIVFIHGGPLNPMMPWGHLYAKKWDSAFTVVQWDQRGVGKSREDPATGEPIAMGTDIATYVQDAIEVINHVRARTGQDKVFLIGHSWGSVVGLRVAEERPDLLHAYIGTGQLLDMEENEATTFELTLDAARAAGNTEAVAELEAVMPYPASVHTATTDEERRTIFTAARKWNSRLLPTGEKVTKDLITAPFLSPDYTLADAFAFVRGVQNADVVNTPIFRQIMDLRFPADGIALDVPVFFLEGRQDHYTESSLVARFMPQISAPQVTLHWFERSGHFSMIQEADAFAQFLIDEVRPLATD